MSPEVFRLPVITKSELSKDAGGFGLAGAADVLGATGAEGALGAVAAGAALGVVVSFGPGSLIFDLENISSCRDKGHRVGWVAILAHFVMQMGPGRASSISHITNSIAARHSFAPCHANTR